MNHEYFWVTTIFLAFGTFSIRFSFIAFSHRLEISERAKKLFSYIPAAILPALIAPQVYFHEGQVSYLLEKERFFILVTAAVICYITKSMIATIAFGLLSLYLTTQIL